MPTVLIQNGTIVNADSTVRADLLIDGPTIKEIRAGIPANAADTVVDATGLLLLPGGIDAHTHLDMPFGGTQSADDFLTGTRAAAIGGTTTIVDFAIQARGTKMRAALDTWWKKAEGKACIDYGLHMIVTDLPDAGLEDMDDLVLEGVASFNIHGQTTLVAKNSRSLPTAQNGIHNSALVQEPFSLAKRQIVNVGDGEVARNVFVRIGFLIVPVIRSRGVELAREGGEDRSTVRQSL